MDQPLRRIGPAKETKAENPSHDDNLLKKIRVKRSHIAAYLSKAEPTANRVTTLTTILSFISAASTTVLTIALRTTQATGLQWLSAGAAVTSLLAGAANQWYRSRDLAHRILKAQAVDAKLETLETLIEVGQVPIKEAISRYEKCVLEVPFAGFPTRRGRRWQSEAPLELMEGQICQPKAGQQVGDSFVCSGTAACLQPDLRSHLWLATEIEGRIWPKETEIVVKEGGSWTKTIFEEGTNEIFAVSLFAANPEGHRYVQDWLRACDRKGTYPELRRTPGMIRLARVTGLRRTLPTTSAPGA